jgi:hypothetical protein
VGHSRRLARPISRYDRTTVKMVQNEAGYHGLAMGKKAFELYVASLSAVGKMNNAHKHHLGKDINRKVFESKVQRTVNFNQRMTSGAGAKPAT